MKMVDLSWVSNRGLWIADIVANRPNAMTLCHSRDDFNEKYTVAIRGNLSNSAMQHLVKAVVERMNWSRAAGSRTQVSVLPIQC